MAIKVGTRMKIILGIVGLLAILLIGFVSFSAMRNWQRQNTVLTTHRPKEVNKKKKQLLSQENRVKPKYSPSSSFTESAENSNKEIDRMIDEFIDGIESPEITDSPQEEEISENNQDIITEYYDERYDMLVEICQQMEPLQDKIENIQDDIKYQFDILKGNVYDIYNPTEDEETIIQEWREKCQPLYEEQKKFIGEYIVLFDEVDRIVPGAVKSEPSSDGNKLVNYIDYVYIKSTLGYVPEDIDFYLSEFFSKARFVSVIYGIEVNKEDNGKNLINEL